MIDFRSAADLDAVCATILEQRDKLVEELRNKTRRRKLTAKEKRTLNQSEESRPKVRRKQPQLFLPQRGDEYIHKLRCCLVSIYQNEGRTVNWPWGCGYLSVCRALLHLLYVDAQYELIHRAIESMDLLAVPRGLLTHEIQDLWDNSSYHLDEKPLERLSSVNRYRIRKQRPCPLRALYGDTRYSFDCKSRAYLDEKYAQVQRPTTQEKILMSNEIGLPLAKVSNWFKNRRQRRRTISLSSSNSEVSSASNCQFPSPTGTHDSQVAEREVCGVQTDNHQDYRTCGACWYKCCQAADSTTTAASYSGETYDYCQYVQCPSIEASIMYEYDDDPLMSIGF